MTVHTIQANMTRGELTPLMHGRVDTEFYGAGLARARNCIVSRYGGIIKVPGTTYEGPAKNASKKARFLPFEFKRGEVYAIEAGEEYFRVWTPAGRIEVASVPVEIATPYQEEDLPYLKVRQAGDVVYIVCRKAAGGAYRPQKLTRMSDTSWTLEDWEFVNGPFLDEETEGTTLTPASYGSVTPTMTGNTSPSGTASDSQGGGDAYRAFDRSPTSDVQLSSATSGWVAYDFPGSTQRVVDAYWITSDDGFGGDCPSSWFFEGFDGSNWIVLDQRNGETGWTNGETRFYEFPNEIAYSAYRIRWTAVSASSATASRIGEMGLHERAEDQTPFNLTASSTAGINGGSGFQTSDVGRFIRLRGSDGHWRTARIAARTSTTVVTIRLYGHSLPDLAPISRWQMGAFSEESGWPGALAIFEDRMVVARTDGDPLGLWMSINGNYDDFGVSTPVVDDDGISARLTGGKLNDIGWLVEGRDLIAGTAGSLRAVGRNNQNAALSPSNVRQRAETLSPSSIAEPIEIENVLLFLDVFEQRLYEAAYTYEVEGYLAREASTLSEHLYACGVQRIAYLSTPHKIIVGLRTDGKLVFTTYDREQKVNGSTLVDFGGVVEDIMELPGTTYTDLWMIVRRTVNGSTVRYVERLAEFWREDFTVQETPLYAACGLIYNGTAVSTLTGADHLIGETVGVWADGRDIGDAVVDSGGEIELPGGVAASEIAIGLRMTMEARTLRLATIGNQDGSGLGRSVKVLNAYIDLYESAGLTAGSLSQRDAVRFEQEAEENPGDPTPLRTGMYQLPVDDSWLNQGAFVIESDRMYPVTVRAISLHIDGEP